MIFPNSQNVTVNGRHNRPTTLGKSYLEIYFTNDGTYVDPVQISSVHIFATPSNATADSFLDLSAGSSSYGLITSGSELSSGLFVFRPSGTDNTTHAGFNKELYDGTDISASAIYKISTGRYGVTLQPDASSFVGNATTSSLVSSVGTFYDIWTVKLTASSDWQTFINCFSLFNDRYIAVTEPIKMAVRTTMITKQMRNGEVRDLVIPNTIRVVNDNLPTDIQNLFSHSVIDNASVRIQKKQERETWLDVSGFADTSGTVIVDSADTIRFLLDTTGTGFTTLNGGAPGIYAVQAKFTILNETFYSEKLTLQILP